MKQKYLSKIEEALLILAPGPRKMVQQRIEFLGLLRREAEADRDCAVVALASMAPLLERIETTARDLAPDFDGRLSDIADLASTALTEINHVLVKEESEVGG